MRRAALLLVLAMSCHHGKGASPDGGGPGEEDVDAVITRFVDEVQGLDRLGGGDLAPHVAWLKQHLDAELTSGVRWVPALRQLQQTAPDRLDELSRHGLAELTAPLADPALHAILAHAAAKLRDCPARVALASPADEAKARAALQLGDLPTGVSQPVVDEVHALAARGAKVDGFRAVGCAGQPPVVLVGWFREGPTVRLVLVDPPASP